MENELFQHKTKKLQKLLDEVHERIAEVQQANEDIAAMLQPSVSLSLLQGGGEQTDDARKPDLMIVYPLATN
jgi:ABC-type Fe3+-hydroxamate transport system substrate-binding protein